MTSSPPLVNPLESIASVTVGQVIAEKYRIDGYLGQGGMGTVLRATHLHLNCTVALKVLHRQFAENDEVVARMIQEARAVAQLRSDHVARVLDAGHTVEKIPYIVMEYLEGEDLGALLQREGPLKTVQAVGFLLQACEAVAEAHSRGIVHRDLKPENLFVTRRADGEPMIKVLDFGIAKRSATLSPRTTRLTNPAMALGSPHYMSPEQMRASAEVDARSDIWSLGAILFELLVGHPPFDGESLPSVCALVLSGETPSLRVNNPEISEELEALVHCCLRKDREDRYAHVAAMAWDLSRFGDHEARDSASRIAKVLRISDPLAGPNIPARVRAIRAAGSISSTVPAVDSVGSSVSSIGPVFMPVQEARSWGKKASVLALVFFLVGGGFLLSTWFKASDSAAANPAADPPTTAAKNAATLDAESTPAQPQASGVIEVVPIASSAAEDAGSSATKRTPSWSQKAGRRAPSWPSPTAAPKVAVPPPPPGGSVNPYDRDNFGNRF